MGLHRRESEGARRLYPLLVLAFLITLIAADTAHANRIVKLERTPKVSKPNPSRVLASPVQKSAVPQGDRLTRREMLGAKPQGEMTPAASFDIPQFKSGSDAGISIASGDFTPVNVADAPERIHGKLFYWIGNQIYLCSGTVVDTSSRKVVFTAGHCVYDEINKKFVDRVAFVPGYVNGTSPFGIYEGYQWFTTSRWASSGSYSYDIGAVVLQEPIEKLGSRRIAFDLRAYLRDEFRKVEFSIYGYPSKPEPRFDGQSLQGCKTKIRGQDSGSNNLAPFPIGARPCGMMQGSSGGGWVAYGNYVSSVMSYAHCGNQASTCGTVFGPYFSNAAKDLYQRVGGTKRPTVAFVKAPPRIVRQRSITLNLGGRSSTLPGFICRLDRQKPVRCPSRISISNLSPGKHTLRVQAIDQTGKKSKNTAIRNFRVVLPGR